MSPPGTLSDTSTSSPQLRLHGRQFVIGPDHFAAADDWISTPLGSMIVSHCPLLRTCSTTDADGRQWMILGVAVQSDAARPDPIDEIAITRTERVPDLCESWAGRWVLAGHSIYLDASGLLGCFFGCDRRGALWASSSPALLARILHDGHPVAADNRTLRYEIGLSWSVPPLSRFDGMNRLLPSQRLVLGDGSVRGWPYMQSIQLARPVAETLELLAANLVTTMRRASFSQPLWLALSAGADSRLILAVARKAGIAFQPYTRLATRTKLADRLIPPLLCAEIGCGHVYFPHLSRSVIAGRRELIAAQGAGHIPDEDVQPLLDGSRDTLTGTTVGGNCFGVGKAWGRNALPSRMPAAGDSLASVAQGLGEPRSSRGMAGVSKWLDWCRESPVAGMDWRDRCYIEVRLAGWLSSKEQIYDVTSLDRFVPINSMRCYSLLLSLPEKLRISAEYQATMIEGLAPELMRHPFNPPDSHFGLLPALIGRARHPMQIVRRGRQRMWRAWNTALIRSGR